MGETSIRVRYQETDRMGHAHHAAYLAWFEAGRSDLIRAAGRSYARIEEEDGILLPVIEVRARYRSPARYDEVLCLATRVGECGKARVTFEYELTREEDGEPVATGSTCHAVLDGARRPVRLPAWLRELLQEKQGDVSASTQERS